ncbi:MAG: LytTR family transcriptional regulator DNA-binding domain-containing protein [Lachnospiraceae bacterium]|nr:LytTR family transcriptional regulator DNA-binding domain-containing protein [Lachnospiraceae bacterium]
MKNMVDIEVVINEKYTDPKVTILTRANTRQVENIIYAIENVSENDFPQIVANDNDKLVFISQRDIVRVYAESRRVYLQTVEGLYTVKRTLSGLEEDLNPDRFIRTSQSEIINIYKVKSFDVSFSGTIGVEFDCGVKSWVSRSRIKQIRSMLKESKICMERSWN